MKTLFDPARADELKQRMATLTPETPALWGKMNAPQVIAHCSLGLQMANGELRLKRMAIGRVLGPVIRKFAVNDDKPMRPNSPTDPNLVIPDRRDLDAERERLAGLIDRFVSGGPAGCTDHPHSFFGKLTPEQWGLLAYKHIDHHLRQFGV